MVRAELEDLHLKAAKLARKRFGIDEPDAEIDSALRWTWEQIMGEEDDPLERRFPLSG